MYDFMGDGVQADEEGKLERKALKYCWYCVQSCDI